MSRPLWRLLLTCILLIALPLKGVAAISQMPCGSEHRGVGTVALDHEDAKSADFDHGDSLGHDSGTSAVLQPGHDHNDDSALGHHHGAKLKCGNCAPCCQSLAPSSSVRSLPAAEPSLGAFEPLHTRYLSAELSGMLRPPKSHLA